MPSTFVPFLPTCYSTQGPDTATPSTVQWRSTFRTRRFTRRSSLPARISAKFELKHPPYHLNGLEPHMSKETLEYHWGKHHRAYVDNLNNQITGTDLEGMSLEDVIVATYNKGDMLPAFNNAAQVWNHDFFWESMKPSGGGKPTGELMELIEKDFGSFEGFVEEFKKAAATQFGSGWAWLVYKTNKIDVENAAKVSRSEDDKTLMVVKSPNAVNPLVWDYSALLTIDVWEHAYYLDFQNRRPDYIGTFMNLLVSWEAVSERLEAAKVRAAEKEMEEQQRRNKAEAKSEDEDNAGMYVDNQADEGD